MPHTPRLLLIIYTALTLAACTGGQGQLRISGEITGINEDQALLLSTDGGLDRIDTLHIQQEALEYQTALLAPATFHIVFSNQSDLLLWAHPGDALTLKGEAQNLRALHIEGNEENELYTDFRLTLATLTQPDSIADAARTFIRRHTDSPVAVEVYRQHFYHDTKEARPLLAELRKAQPDNATLKAYERALRQRARLKKGARLPAFTLKDTQGRTHRLRDYRGHYLMLIIWAAWQSTNPPAFYHARELLDQGTRDTLSVLSLSLDIERRLVDAGLDDAHWPTCAPLQGWDTPYIQQLGLHTLPYTLLVGPDGKIIAAGADYGRDVRAEAEKLKK